MDRELARKFPEQGKRFDEAIDRIVHREDHVMPENLVVHKLIVRRWGISCVCRAVIKPEFWNKGGGGRIPYEPIAAAPLSWRETIERFNNPEVHHGTFDPRVDGIGRVREGESSGGAQEDSPG